MARLADAGVDSIGALGSTGSYAYLSRAERARAARLAVEAAGGVPVMIGIGAVRTEHVLEHAHDAQDAGAAAVMLAPVSYQALTEDEVYGLYADVTAELSVPLCVYDNPGTTHFAFSDELHARVAALPQRAARSSCPATGAAERIAGAAAAGAGDGRARRQRRPVRRRRARRRRGRVVQRARRALPARPRSRSCASASRRRRGSSRCGRCSAATAASAWSPPRRRCSAWRASTTSRARCGCSTATPRAELEAALGRSS